MSVKNSSMNSRKISTSRYDIVPSLRWLKAHMLQILPATNRKETQDLLPQLIARRGPVDAFIIRMGTPAYEPFDEDLLGSLLPHCKIITSGSAGFNEFDVDWMTRNKIWFCNTRNAVAEATADMALFLILAVLRDTTRAEKGARSDSWKAGLVPCRDPTGMTLGIVGMGAIGKVRLTLLSYLPYFASCLVPRTEPFSYGLSNPT
jgi:lactate dehydrogenase-like 2-hydroxyacid dehydrogenase